MTTPTPRERLADRAAELYRAGGKTYTEAVDAAMVEMNPTNDPKGSEKLLRALLNVPEPVVHPKRRSPRADEPRADMDGTTKAGGPGATQSEAGDAPDGGETFTGK